MAAQRPGNVGTPPTMLLFVRKPGIIASQDCVDLQACYGCVMGRFWRVLTHFDPWPPSSILPYKSLLVSLFVKFLEREKKL